VQILDQDFCTVRFEADTVVAVVDDAVLDYDVCGAVCVPAISVFGQCAATAVTADRDVAEDDVATVGHEVVVLRRVPEVEIGDAAVVQTDRAKKNGTQNVDVLCV